MFFVVSNKTSKLIDDAAVDEPALSFREEVTMIDG